ncbi:MAG TPA: hypothetical protein VJH67_03850 [Candidatus Paceibacterota bacterium]
MNRLLQVLFLLVLLVGVTLVAQEAPENIPIIEPAGGDNPTGGTYCFMGYVPKDVNALWHIVGSRWREALAHPKNVVLQEAEREFTKKGMVFYAMNLGECFFVPPGMKAYVPLIAEEVVKSDGARNEGGTNATSNEAAIDTPPIVSDSILLGVFFLFVVVLTIFVIIEVKRDRTNRLEALNWERDHPAEAGPPVIEGGMEQIRAVDRIEVATGLLQDVAAASFVPDSKPREYRVIGEIVRGVLNGTGMVQYDGIDPQERVFTDTPAVRALMEHIPTGQRVHRFVLWACANGAWSQMIGGDGLTFTPTLDQNGLQIRLQTPIVQATAADVQKYGEPDYDPRYDTVAAAMGRNEPLVHLAADLPRRNRVFIGGER